MLRVTLPRCASPNKVRYTASGEMVWHAGRLGILYNALEHKQRFYMGQAAEVNGRASGCRARERMGQGPPKSRQGGGGWWLPFCSQASYPGTGCLEGTPAPRRALAQPQLGLPNL